MRHGRLRMLYRKGGCEDDTLEAYGDPAGYRDRASGRISLQRRWWMDQR